MKAVLNPDKLPIVTWSNRKTTNTFKEDFFFATSSEVIDTYEYELKSISD